METTVLRACHDQCGAQWGEFFGLLLPRHYGDPAAEYTWLNETAAVVDTGFQFPAELSGPDRVRYLNAVTTGNIRDLPPGQSTLGLLLNPQGHILAELLTLALEDRLLCLSHRVASERTLATLERYIIMDDVMLTNLSPTLASVAVLGPRAASSLAALGLGEGEALSPGEHCLASFQGTPLRLLRASLLGLPAWEILAPHAVLATLWQQAVEVAKTLGGGPVGYEAINVLRLEQGVPWYGVDFDDRVIPHEAGLESTHISYVKGCYTGQEIVERVRSRGHINRRRLGLAFTGDTAPPAGAPLLADGRQVGWVTSSVRSRRWDRLIGMGYLRREYHAPGTRVQWSAGQAEVVSLPLDGAPGS